MEIYPITPNLKLLNLQPPIPGYQNFIGAYLFCGERKAIVDVGPRAAVPGLMSALAELGIGPDEIDYVVLTHIHMDHAGGVGTSLSKMNRAQVVAHGSACSHLIDPIGLWEGSLKTLGDVALKYGRIEPVPEDRIVAAEDLMKLDLGRDLVLEMHHTPGHAFHHLSLFDRTNGVLMAGDTAGVCIDGTVRPSTPPPFNLEEALSSIDRLIALRPQKLCYGHFGCYDDAGERLGLIKQKVLMWHEIVKSAVKAGKKPEGILARLREKDKSLDYLDVLDGDEYRREHSLLINSVTGLSRTVSASYL